MFLKVCPYNNKSTSIQSLSVCIVPDLVASHVMLVSSFSYLFFLVLESQPLNFDQIIFEGVYALHPDIRASLDLWIAVVRMSLHPSLKALFCFIYVLFVFAEAKSL